MHVDKKSISILLFIFLIVGLFIALKLFYSANQTEIKFIKNLKKQHYPEQLFVTQSIAGLSAKTNSDEYRLSMVVIASAQQGNEKLYQKTLMELQNKLNAVAKNKKDPKNNSYRAWHLGRILLAADSIDDKHTVAQILPELKSLLTDEKTAKDAYSAWGWGYLASLNKKEYKSAKSKMLESANALTEQYQQAKTHADNSEESQMALQIQLSNALWAWVMDAQAAANANDEKIFNFILEQMKTITGEKTVGLALTKGLQRLSTSNDYPAWALGIVRLAAATIGNKAIYDELEKPLADSIQGAKDAMKLADDKSAYNATAEATLAQVDSALAIVRWSKQGNRI